MRGLEWYRLKVVDIKDRTFRILLKFFEEYEDIFKVDKRVLQDSYKLEIEEIEKIWDSQKVDLKEEIDKLREDRVSLLFIKDGDYPEELKNIAKPPIFMYYRGDISILKGKKIGVVGTRRPTSYGKIACEKLVRELVENGVTTVSGLASGIDRICHQKTLENGGKSIAIVGSGLDVVYPKENERLWQELGEKGLIMSEYPLGTLPYAYNFPMRNRVIVGISQGITVVESKIKGGSLITAELALEEGREVFAIPGEIFSPVSEGCNNLIKNSSAKLVTSVEDILDEFNWKKRASEEKKKLNLTEYEEKIYNVLEREKNLDEIIMATLMKPGEILSILMDLEVKKVVMSVPGGKYRRKI